MERFAAVGRRKTSVARVYIQSGEGKIVINKKPLLEYVCRETLKIAIEEPMKVTDSMGKFDVIATVCGGGLSGQAGAIRLGIARALLLVNPEWRSILRRNGFLTRDPRMVERKKYGQPGARKRFQYSKR